MIIDSAVKPNSGGIEEMNEIEKAIDTMVEKKREQFGLTLSRYLIGCGVSSDN